jgi:phage shock protein B
VAGILALLIPLTAISAVFIILPWMVLHYTAQWKKAASLTIEDEKLLDDLYETARRLEARLETVERIVAADQPDFRPGRGA